MYIPIVDRYFAIQNLDSAARTVECGQSASCRNPTIKRGVKESEIGDGSLSVAGGLSNVRKGIQPREKLTAVAVCMVCASRSGVGARGSHYGLRGRGNHDDSDSSGGSSSRHNVTWGQEPCQAETLAASSSEKHHEDISEFQAAAESEKGRDQESYVLLILPSSEGAFFSFDSFFLYR